MAVTEATSTGAVGSIPPETGIDSGESESQETSSQTSNETSTGDIGEGDINSSETETKAPSDSGDTDENGNDKQNTGSSTLDAHDDSTSKTTSGSTSESQETSLSAPDRDKALTYEELIARAKSGDTKAQKLLQQWETSSLLPTDSQPILDELAAGSTFSDEKERTKQENLYQKALSHEALLSHMEKKARQASSQLPKESPLRQSLLQQADFFKATRQHLKQQMTLLDQRLHDGKSKNLTSVYNNLLKLKSQGLILTPQQQAKLAMYEQKFGSFKAGQADLYQAREKKMNQAERSQQTDSSKSEPKKHQPQLPTKTEVKKSKEELREEMLHERASIEPKDEEVVRAEAAVRALFGEEKLQKNKEIAQKRKVFIEWAREKKEQIDSGEPTGEAGLMYSIIYSAGMTGLTQGRMGMVAGLKFLGQGVRHGVEEGQAQLGDVSGAVSSQVEEGEIRQATLKTSQDIMNAAPGEEGFYKNRAALASITGRIENAVSDSDTEYKQVKENGGMPVLRFLNPHSAARLQRTRDIGNVVA